MYSVINSCLLASFGIQNKNKRLVFSISPVCDVKLSVAFSSFLFFEQYIFRLELMVFSSIVT